MGVRWFIDLPARKIMRPAIGKRRNGIFAPHFAEKCRLVFGQTIPPVLTFLAPPSDDSIESAA
jgi:hypothetical protein